MPKLKTLSHYLESDTLWSPRAVIVNHDTLRLLS